jgi:pyruvate/2-oxoglutarate/acetoin dehydrogenase E1 component
LSDREFICPVIIRAVAGSVKPFYAGPTHTSDLTDIFKTLFSFPVLAPRTVADTLGIYDAVAKYDRPVLVSELKGSYDDSK